MKNLFTKIASVALALCVVASPVMESMAAPNNNEETDASQFFKQLNSETDPYTFYKNYQDKESLFGSMNTDEVTSFSNVLKYISLEHISLSENQSEETEKVVESYAKFRNDYMDVVENIDQEEPGFELISEHAKTLSFVKEENIIDVKNFNEYTEFLKSKSEFNVAEGLQLMHKIDSSVNEDEIKEAVEKLKQTLMTKHTDEQNSVKEKKEINASDKPIEQNDSDVKDFEPKGRDLNEVFKKVTEEDSKEKNLDSTIENYILANLNNKYIDDNSSKKRTRLRSVQQESEMNVVNIMPVKQTLVDASKITKEDTIDSIMSCDDALDSMKMIDRFQTMIIASVPVYDVDSDSDYYVASVNTMQDDPNAKVQDADFAILSNYGEALNDCVYDYDTGLAYIPKKHFYNAEGKQELAGVQVQLLQAMSGKLEAPASEIKVLTDNNGELEKDILKVNAYEMETTVLTSKDLSKDRLVVAVNGIPLEEEEYDYDATTGKIKVNRSSAQIQTLTVDIKSTKVATKIKQWFEPMTAKAAYNASNLPPISSRPIQLPNGAKEGSVYVKNNITKGGINNNGGVNIRQLWYPNYPNDSNVSNNRNAFICAKYYRNGHNGFGNAYGPGIADVNDAQINSLVHNIINGNYNNIDLNNLNKLTSGTNIEVLLNKSNFGELSFASLGNTSIWLKCAHIQENINGQYPMDNLADAVNLNRSDLPKNVYGNPHISMPTGYGWISAGCRILKLTNDYAIIGLVSAPIGSQSGAGIFKVKISPSEGHTVLHKSSANPDLTNGNACYSLQGAEYGIYTDQKCTKKVASFTTDVNGNSNKVKLKAGEYFVKETKAPKGYALDHRAYKIKVVPNQTAELKVTDVPTMDPVGILLGKIDKETNQNKPQGSASLENAHFEVKYYKGLWQKDVDPATLGKSPARTWVFKTNKNGFIYYKENYLISENKLYYSPNGVASLPVGTITIQEVKAPDGYKINPTVYVRQITDDGAHAENVITYNNPTVPEELLNLYVTKTVKGKDTRIPGVVFTHICPDGTKEDVTTDSNGEVVIKGLTRGSHSIIEKSVPEGFVRNPGEVKFHVTEDSKIVFDSTTATDQTGNMNFHLDTDGTAYLDVEDVYAPFSLDLHKQNEKGKKLFGAEFTLYSDKECKNELQKNKTGLSGNLTFDDLEVGETYYIKETKAPKGYRIPVNKDGSDIVFEIKTESDPLNKIFKYYVNGELQKDELVTGNVQERIVNLTVINDAGLKLPDTGTHTGLIMSVIGLGLMGAALIFTKKKK